MMTARSFERSLSPAGALRNLLVVGLAVGFAPAGCDSGSARPEAVGSATSAASIPGLFATGVDGTGTPLAVGSVDPHWVLTSTDPGFPGPNAIVPTLSGSWTPNTTTSTWISVASNDRGNGGFTYTYSTTFSLTGFAPPTATISGDWACDHSCNMFLNGTHVGSLGVGNFNTFNAFTIASGGPFVVGVNTLSIEVNTTSGGPTGIQVGNLSSSAKATCVTSAGCSGTTPVCDPGTLTCVPCNGDNGSGATDACSTTQNPYCTVLGGCSTCMSDVDCTTGTHAGPYCNTATGACTTACQSDAECGAGHWCDNLSGPGMCEAQIANGHGVSGQTCASFGTRACLSGACDTHDNLCGYANGDGPCSAVNGTIVCRSMLCATSGANMDVCVQCLGNGDCGVGLVCDPLTNTCGPGSDAGAGDAGVVDSGSEAGADAGSHVDAGHADAGSDASGSDSGSFMDASEGDATADGSPDASDMGTVAGGGLSCRMTGANADDAAPGALAAVLGIGVMFARRRHR